MKSILRSISLPILFSSYALTSSAQALNSQFKPKNKTEKLVLAEIYALPEMKEHLKEHPADKAAHPAFMLGAPDSSSKYYTVQVGFDFPDRFSTNYYLSIDPKTYAIYYNDFFDESGDKLISLKQWRRWRNKPEFQYRIHIWKHGELVVSKQN